MAVTNAQIKEKLEEMSAQLGEIRGLVASALDGGGPTDEELVGGGVPARTRDDLRELARRMLADGLRDEVVEVLGRFGGSVPEVPEADVGAACEALEGARG